MLLSHSELQQAGCSGSSCAAYIGLSRNSEGQFTNWLDGAPFGGSIYAAWNTGEPNSPGAENCVELITDSGKWNDISCITNRLAMCEKPPPATGCEIGWSAFGQSCYRLVTPAQSFDVHRATCENSGGWLVSINSAEENNFVIRKVYRNTKPLDPIRKQ